MSIQFHQKKSQRSCRVSLKENERKYNKTMESDNSYRLFSPFLTDQAIKEGITLALASHFPLSEITEVAIEDRSLVPFTKITGVYTFDFSAVFIAKNKVKLDDSDQTGTVEQRIQDSGHGEIEFEDRSEYGSFAPKSGSFCQDLVLAALYRGLSAKSKSGLDSGFIASEGAVSFRVIPDKKPAEEVAKNFQPQQKQITSIIASDYPKYALDSWNVTNTVSRASADSIYAQISEISALVDGKRVKVILVDDQYSACASELEIPTPFLFNNEVSQRHDSFAEQTTNRRNVIMAFVVPALVSIALAVACFVQLLNVEIVWGVVLAALAIANYPLGFLIMKSMYKKAFQEYEKYKDSRKNCKDDLEEAESEPKNSEEKSFDIKFYSESKTLCVSDYRSEEESVSKKATGPVVSGLKLTTRAQSFDGQIQECVFKGHVGEIVMLTFDHEKYSAYEIRKPCGELTIYASLEGGELRLFSLK